MLLADRKDDDLVCMTVSGSMDAFGVLYDRYFSSALRFARRLVKDKERSKDLVQESMLEAYLGLKHLKKPESFRSWLFTIIRNVCISHIRHSSSFLSIESLTGGMSIISDGSQDPQAIADYGELRQIVLSAINGLSESMQQPVRLFYYDRLPIQEIAASLGISLSAVKVRLFRARLILKETLYRLLIEHSFEEYVRRGRRMLKVSILDVVKAEGTDASAILLLDERNRLLPICVGEAEGMAIALGVKKHPLPRPLTYDLVANLLESIDAKITKVHVEALKESTFYGLVFIKSGGTEKQLDARPSDAIALSLRTGSPIFVSEEVMERAGMDIPEEKLKTKMDAHGMDSIIDQLEEKIKRRKKKNVMKKPPPELKKENMRKNLLAHAKSKLDSKKIICESHTSSG